jgi:hypothetical protein
MPTISIYSQIDPCFLGQYEAWVYERASVQVAVTVAERASCIRSVDHGITKISLDSNQSTIFLEITDPAVYGQRRVWRIFQIQNRPDIRKITVFECEINCALEIGGADVE